ncbi:hypothetical protein HMPREF9622_01423 [Cutibacterium modestum HL037PA3]|nr:hypothetical protein HMPREF9622_01423 [Cutibacterium modestum HL037PA3]
MDACRVQGIRSVSLSVDAGNEVAVAMYRRAGFIQVSDDHDHPRMLWVDGDSMI